MLSRPPLILASTSRYRQELLSRLRLPFEVCAPEVDERRLPQEQAPAMAMRLALAKARAVADRRREAVVIGSDQVADLHGQTLGKPGTYERALHQLRQQSGQHVGFHTAVAVVCTARSFERVALSTVDVVFRKLDDSQIEHYLRTEQPFDCAGSAKCETLGIALVQSIESDDPTSLVGLPLIRTCELLRQVGVDPLHHTAP